MLQFRMVTKPGSLKTLVLLAPGAASFQTLSTNRKRSFHILLMIKNRTSLTSVWKTKSCMLQPKMPLSKRSSHTINLGGPEEQFPLSRKPKTFIKSSFICRSLENTISRVYFEGLCSSLDWTLTSLMSHEALSSFTKYPVIFCTIFK